MLYYIYVIVIYDGVCVRNMLNEYICLHTVYLAEQIRKRLILNMMKLMNIINDNTYNLHNSLLNNDSWYMKVPLKSKLIGVVR